MPGDFVAMKMEEDKKILIILGRPFLSTAGVITDMREDTLTMRVGGKRIQFQFDKAIKYPYVAMKVEEDKKVPIILGIPFLRTTVVITDMREDTLTVRVGDKRIQFQFDKTVIYPFIAMKMEEDKKVPINFICNLSYCVLLVASFLMIYNMKGNFERS
jgi:hypothetical protein